MSLELYEHVALTRDLPEHHLRKGDVGVLIDRVPHPNGGEEGSVVEVFNAIGDSIAVVAVPLSCVAPLTADEILSVRSLLPVG